MEKGKIKFHKAYTRDTSLIMQESWYKAITEGAEELFGKANLHIPPTIYFMNDGVIEVWENTASTQWYTDTLFEKNKNDQGFFDKILEKYIPLLKKAEEYWKKEKLDSAIELKQFLDLIFEITKYFVCVYYTGVDERTPEKIREKALNVRNLDSFFASSDETLRNTLVHLYPDLKGIETGLRKNELESFPSKGELMERKKNCIMIPGIAFKNIDIYKFQAISKNYEFEFEEIDPSILDNGIIKGQIAQLGIIIGKVRILKRREQVGEVKEGEIIVSSMTTPDFLPAMKKAAAFITDEGGITCHAAIVAREMKKPCIIGTKIATKVLKDGMMVEVDANAGVVKIIK